jgi:hypothetical protein
LNAKRVERAPAAQPAPKRIKYEEVRDQFLKEPPATDEEALDFFVHLGMYVYGRWQSIAADTGDGPIVDEDCNNRWDDCTDHEFDELRTRAEELIGREVAHRRISALLASVVKEPFGTILKGVGWALWQMWEHFWGAVGLLLFGLIFVWLAPHVAREVRSALDETLPHDTRPPPATGQPPTGLDNKQKDSP